MNHAAEGLLQAYLDHEVDRAAAAGIEGHLAGCEECRAELERMRARSLMVAGALAHLGEAPEPQAAQQAWWRVQAAARRPAPRRTARFAMGALARAAAILLVFAGALAAIPGSPVRKLLARLLAPEAPATVVAPAAGPETPAVTLEAPGAPPAPAELPGVSVTPADGRVRVMLWAAAPGATIRVNLVDGSRVSVEAGSDAAEVRFRTGSGRVEVMNLGSADAVIRIPRSLPFASLDVDGRQWWFKDGDQLRLNGPVVEQGPDGVVFRVD